MAGLKGRVWLRICAEVRASSDVHVCHLCKRLIDMELPATDAMSWTLDHIDPRARGGSRYARHNLAPAHRRCNSSKGARTHADVHVSTPW